MKKRKLSTKISLLTLLIADTLLSSQVYASTVSSDIPYQYYLDFANNRGEFTAGKSGQKIYDRNGNLLTTLNVPMVDFSAANINGRFATLVDPQHVVSVIHNVGYRSVQFGQENNQYALINSNTCYKYSDKELTGIYCKDDFHSPRLNKLVTDVAPAEIFNSDLDYKDLKSDRYTYFYRTGTGTQSVYNPKTKKSTWLAGPYGYATGGIDDPHFISLDGHVVNYKKEGEHFNTLWLAPDDFKPSATNPLPTLDESGDSGSPLYVYDNVEKKWKVISVVHAGTWWHNKNVRYRTLIPIAFYQKILKKDDVEITTQANQTYKLDKDTEHQDNYKLTTDSGDLIASFGGLGTLANNVGFEYPDWNNGKNYLNKALDHGKNIILSGGGIITLQNNVNQGAGSITFNDDYTVNSVVTRTPRSHNRPDKETRYTWTGGGLNIAEGKTVTWQINESPYPINQNNNLHKIGKGTLIINAVGLNTVGLRIGDGLTILKQQQDTNGFVGAGDELWIVSGRPTVRLDADGQLLPDTIYWGYRGGIFDTNGHNLDFGFLNGSDIGARLDNQNKEKSSTIELNPDYSYSDGKPYLYHGQLLGNIDFNLDFNKKIKNPADETANSKIENQAKTYIFDGSIGNENNALKSFTQTGGNVVLQGHPVIHSYVWNGVNNTLATIGEKAATTPVSPTQSDWENRTYYINKVSINDGTLTIGRNANLIVNEVMELNNAKLELGSNKVYTDPNDGRGVFHYKKLTNNWGNKSRGIVATETEINYANLDDNNKARFTGKIIADNSQINLSGIDFNSQVQAKNNTVINFNHSRVTGKFKLSNSTLNLNSSYFAGNFTNEDITLEQPKRRIRRSLVLLTLPTEVAEVNSDNDEITDNSTVNLTDSRYELTQDQTLKNLNLSGNSKITFAPSQSGITLTVDNLTATQQNFIFNLYDENKTDKLVVKKNIDGKDNNILLNVKASNEKELLSLLSKKIELISVPQGIDLSEKFTLQPVTAFGKSYNLNSSVNDDTLNLAGYQIGYLPNDIKDFSELSNTPLYLFIQQANLSKNIGRFDKNNTVYVDANRTKSEINKLKLNSKSITIGAERQINDKTKVGFNTQFIQSNAKLDMLKNNVKQYLISSYLEYNFKNIFTHFEAKYSRINQNIDGHNIELNKNQIATDYVMLSSQVGYNYNAIKNLNIQPSLQLTSGYLRGYKNQAKYLDINIEKSTPIIVKGKVDIIKSWDLAKIKLGLGYEYNQGMNKALYTSANIQYPVNQFKDKGFFINLGYFQKIVNGLNLSVSAQRSFKQKLKQDTQLKLGLNYQF